MNRTLMYAVGVSAALLAFLAWLNTPSLTITSPAANASVCEPFSVAVSWQGRLLSLEVTLDGTAITNIPVTIDAQNQRATATSDGDAGRRTLTATASLVPRFFSGFVAVTTYTATRSFTIRDPTLTISPTMAVISQSGSQPATLTRGCMNPAVPLSVAVSSDRPIVATPAPSPTPIPANQASATVQITTGNRPGTAAISASAQYHSQSVRSATPMAVRVKRASGDFVRVNPTFAMPNGTLGSGSFSVRVGPAIVNPQVPPPYASFDAQFKNGPAGGGSNVASAIRFSTASLGGGAGFCGSGPVGVVFSGYPAGHPSDYIYWLVDLRATTPVIQEFEVFSRTAATGTGAPLLFRPTLLFSPDCSLAAVAGAHPQGGPEPHFLNVVDVFARAPIPSCEVGFGGLDDGGNLSARVVDRPNDVQQVEVLVGGSIVATCTLQ